MKIRTRPTDREVTEWSSPPPVGTYRIDPSRTTVEFAVRNLVVKKVHGRFYDVAGRIMIDEDVHRSSVRAEIRVASIDTGLAARDNHLRSADFFDAATHPVIRFRSTDLESLPDGTWRLDGVATALGIDHPLSLTVTAEQEAPAVGVRPTISFAASAEVDRLEWGVGSNDDPADRTAPLIGRTVAVRMRIVAEATVPT